jgi:plasmid maintenance system antidote protein VapI
MANKKPLQKEQARYLYFHTHKSQKEIAASVGVTPKSISHWVCTEKWAEQKKALYYSPEQLIQQLYNQLREINTNIANRKEGERYANKEELEANTKIIALITSIAKTNPDTWRNINPEFDLSENTPAPAEEEMTSIFQHKGKEIGKIKMGSIPMEGKQPDGSYKFDKKTMHQYYSKVAALIASAEVPGNYPTRKQETP